MNKKPSSPQPYPEADQSKGKAANRVAEPAGIREYHAKLQA